MRDTGILAVAFDLGGTLEEIYYDDALRLEATGALRGLLRNLDLDPGLPVPELYAVIVAGLRAYDVWRRQDDVELPPERVWPDFVFPGYPLPRERLQGAGEELALFYESHFYTRHMRPEAPVALARLRERGLRLALISNIMARGHVHRCLAGYGLQQYFDPILASSVFGRRKPSPTIFLEATRLLGLPPASCAYVGDTISRDVAGARRAGYGLAIQIRSFLTDKADGEGDRQHPDALIEDLRQIADIVAPTA